MKLIEIDDEIDCLAMAVMPAEIRDATFEELVRASEPFSETLLNKMKELTDGVEIDDMEEPSLPVDVVQWWKIDELFHAAIIEAFTSRGLRSKKG